MPKSIATGISETVKTKTRKADKYMEREDPAAAGLPVDNIPDYATVRDKAVKNIYTALKDWKEVILLGSAIQKPEGQMTPLEKMNVSRMGVSKKDLERLKETTGLDYDTLARALSVTRATLINKKSAEKFNIPLSERIVGLAEIYSFGYEVFEDIDHFNQWMFRPNQALGGEAPYELIDNQFGREEVRNIIGRIDYGVYS